MRPALLILMAMSAVAVTGCVAPRKPVVPVPVVSWSDEAREHDCLLVFLPGISDLPADFERHGFVDLARRAGVRCDLEAVDSHFGYFENHTIVERLEDDVVRPARARGYQHVWLAGISLGGLAALLYADRHPSGVDGLVLIAPYLGEKDIVAEVATAGGVRRWTASSDAKSGSFASFQTELWRSIQRDTAPGATYPPIYLAYGLSDRYAPSHRLLADALPPSNVLTAPGGHDWTTWRTLWSEFLASSPLPK